MEAAPRQYQDRGIHQKGKAQGQCRIQAGIAQGPMAGPGMDAPVAGLHQGGVQIEVVGHHRGTKNAGGQVELLAIPQVGRLGNKAGRHLPPWGLQQEYLHGKAGPHQQHQGDHQGLQPPDPKLLQAQQHQGV